MPHPADQSCLNCLYFTGNVADTIEDAVASGDRLLRVGIIGECRKDYPKSTTCYGGRLSVQVSWPAVNSDDWCGGFAPAPVKQNSGSFEDLKKVAL